MNNTGNVMQLQQEAAARVQRLQEHSRRLVQEHPVNVYRGVTFTPPSKQPPSPPQETPPPCTAPPAAPPAVGSALETLLQGDKEQSLVLLLAVLLAKNGAPLELVLALLYIAM